MTGTPALVMDCGVAEEGEVSRHKRVSPFQEEAARRLPCRLRPEIESDWTWGISTSDGDMTNWINDLHAGAGHGFIPSAEKFFVFS